MSDGTNPDRHGGRISPTRRNGTRAMRLCGVSLLVGGLFAAALVMATEVVPRVFGAATAWQPAGPTGFTDQLAFAPGGQLVAAGG
jgi:hypothetical protein